MDTPATTTSNIWSRLLGAFKNALWVGVSAPGQSRLGWLGALLVLTLASFTMLWLGDKLNASGMALTRFMARAQAPLTAQFHYPALARDKITVALYDQEFLEASGSAWPISYQSHADGLLRLAADPSARPRAIMLDITFGQERDDPTVDSLRQALCRIQNEFKVPVFLAALPSPETGRLAVRAGLGADSPGTAPPCFTLVGVDYLPDPLDGLAWSYPLTRHLADAGWQPGPASEPLRQPAYRSAAMAMAQDAAGLDLGLETVPMALVWGHNSAPQAHRPKRLANCRPGTPELRQLVPGVLRQLWEDSNKPPLCPYHRTLSMAQLEVLEEGELAPYLAGRYVLVGAHVPGFNDFADSPVHRITPGIYMHAMALDNLLTYGSRYKLSAEWTLPPTLELLVPGLLTIGVVFAVHLLWNALQSWLVRAVQARGWPPALAGLRAGYLARPERTRRLLGLPVVALAWLARLSLQSIAAMVLIGLLQARFRIGMLPVVELVGMTLLAEGLGYLKKIQTLLEEKPAECPTCRALTSDPALSPLPYPKETS